MEEININAFNEFKQFNEEQEQYEKLMDIFLSRRDKRKLDRIRKRKTFTDRIYGR